MLLQEECADNFSSATPELVVPASSRLLQPGVDGSTTYTLQAEFKCKGKERLVFYKLQHLLILLAHNIKPDLILYYKYYYSSIVKTSSSENTKALFMFCLSALKRFPRTLSQFLLPTPPKISHVIFNVSQPHP